MQSKRESPQLTEHELDQELLYRVWKDGRVRGNWVLWSDALAELERQAPCTYLLYLLQCNPPLVK